MFDFDKLLLISTRVRSTKQGLWIDWNLDDCMSTLCFHSNDWVFHHFIKDERCAWSTLQIYKEKAKGFKSMLQEPRFQCLGFLVLYCVNDIFSSLQHCFLVCCSWFEKSQFLMPDSKHKIRIYIHGNLLIAPPIKSLSLQFSDLQILNSTR